MATILQGFVLLASGMGIVFLFLMLLVWVMNQTAAIIPRFNHILPDEAPKRLKSTNIKSGSHAASEMVAVAIAAARARSL